MTGESHKESHKVFDYANSNNLANKSFDHERFQTLQHSKVQNKYHLNSIINYENNREMSTLGLVNDENKLKNARCNRTPAQVAHLKYSAHENT